MPMATRRQTQGGTRGRGGSDVEPIAHAPVEFAAVEAAPMEISADEGIQNEEEELGIVGDEEEIDDEEEDDEEEAEDEEDDGDDVEVQDQEVFPPPGLKEISSLASWTVSTAKPGNGVAALRSPDLSHFWQSDGPQPHLLSIHFFKRVSIVHMRIFLDFSNDESYTPTKIQFLAGMGLHDMQEFAEMSFDQPQGWKDVDFSAVGRPEDYGESSDDDDDEAGPNWSRRPVLRAFVVQIFAKDEMQQIKPLLPSKATRGEAMTLPERRKSAQGKLQVAQDHMKPASWMLEPDLR